MRRKHARGEITVCGKTRAGTRRVARLGRRTARARVRGRARGGPRARARRRGDERRTASASSSPSSAAARFGDFVVGDATSNVFLMTLELIAARKRVADLPRLVEWKDEHEEEEEARGGRERGGHPNASERGPEVSERLRRCPSNDPELGACAWVSGLGLSFQIGWHSVLLNDPWVNGVPRVVEWGNRVGEAEVERRRARRREGATGRELAGDETGRRRDGRRDWKTREIWKTRDGKRSRKLLRHTEHPRPVCRVCSFLRLSFLFVYFFNTTTPGDPLENIRRITALRDILSDDVVWKVTRRAAATRAAALEGTAPGADARRRRGRSRALRTPETHHAMVRPLPNPSAHLVGRASSAASRRRTIARLPPLARR